MHKTKAVAAIYRQPTIMGGIFSSGDFLVFHRNLRTCRHACMIGFPKCDNFWFFGGQPKILVDLHASNPTRPPAVHPTRRAPCMCIQPDAPRWGHFCPGLPLAGNPGQWSAKSRELYMLPIVCIFIYMYIYINVYTHTFIIYICIYVCKNGSEKIWDKFRNTCIFWFRYI